MGNYKDLVGYRFGKLIILRYLGSTIKGGHAMWECLCDCGNITTTTTNHLNAGHTTSCGCAGRQARLRAKTKHGDCGTRLYGAYRDMKSRCYNHRNVGYRHYGGKGIRVCEKWLDSYGAFKEWALLNGYNDELTLDRRDINKDYCPENCRWATFTEQQNNTSRTRRILYNGNTQSVAEWARELGLPYTILYSRLKQSGWDAVKVFRELVV